MRPIPLTIDHSRDRRSSEYDALPEALSRCGVEQAMTLVVLGSGMSGCFSPDEYDLLVEGTGSTVVGHSNRIALLRNVSTPTLLALGRRHLYEGWRPDDVVELITVAARLGVRNLILTNASGGLNLNFATGDVMLIEECIVTLLGKRALVSEGERVRAGEGERVRRKMFDAGSYDLIERSALRRGLALKRGVYAAVTGPSYETRAEIRMLRRMGCDVVGMSTAIEAATAATLGMCVIGFSLVTNMLSDTRRLALDHRDVVEASRRAVEDVRRAIDAALEVLR